MKKYSLLLLSSVLFLGSCTSGRMATRSTSDDVYYSGRDDRYSSTPDYSSAQPAPASSGTVDYNNSNNQNNNSTTTTGNQDTDRFRENSGYQTPNSSSTEQYTDGNGTTYITNNYYDDYYDYQYTSQIRRFNHPCGWSYYDPYYTNTYWYDYNPYAWGVSLYTSYNWWNPVYSPGWGFNIGFGNAWGYNPWYGGYGGFYGYNNYWNGYNQGYMNGYYAGLYNGTFNPYYYNSYDPYSYYYGPRNTAGGGGRVADNIGRGGKSISELYGRDVASNTSAIPDDRIRNPRESMSGMDAIGRPKHNTADIRPATNTDVRTPRENIAPVKGDIRDVKQNTPLNPRDNAPVKSNTHNQSNGPVRDTPAPIRENGDPRSPKNTAPTKQYQNDRNNQVPTRNNEVPAPRQQSPRGNENQNPAPRNTQSPRSDNSVNPTNSNRDYTTTRPAENNASNYTGGPTNSEPRTKSESAGPSRSNSPRQNMNAKSDRNSNQNYSSGISSRPETPNYQAPSRSYSAPSRGGSGSVSQPRVR